MKQTSFIPSSSRVHGGSLSVGKRRGWRPLSTSKALHVTLKSDFAKGQRSLLLHQDLIHKIIKKVERLFGVKVYRYAVCRNHIHILMRGKTRVQLQNSFRVLAGPSSSRLQVIFCKTA